MVHYGVGRHQFYIEASPKLSGQFPRAIELLTISELMGLLSTMFTKVSICFFLLRIFGTIQLWKRSLYGIIAFAVVVNIGSASTSLVQCSPHRKAWNPLILGTCWSPVARLAIGEFNGGGYIEDQDFLHMCAEKGMLTLKIAVAVSCDWALASLPIVFMWEMQMSVRKKLGICILMSTGFLSVFSWYRDGYDDTLLCGKCD